MPPQVATDTAEEDGTSPAPAPEPSAEATEEFVAASEPVDQVSETAAMPGSPVDGDGPTDLTPGDDDRPDDPVDGDRRSIGSRVRARRLRARKVRRTIRHIDPWSVLKFSLFFFLAGWVVVVLAGVMLWSLAVNSGVVTDFEDLVIELFDLTSFAVDPDLMFRVAVFAGGAFALGGALFMGVLAVLFNLLSDLLGGIRVSVIEEETARPIVG